MYAEYRYLYLYINWNYALLEDLALTVLRRKCAHHHWTFYAESEEWVISQLHLSSADLVDLYSRAF